MNKPQSTPKCCLIAMRTFLILLLVCGTSTALALAAPPPRTAAGKQTYSFQSARKPGVIDHVVVVLEVAGERKEKNEGKTQSAPITAVCNLEYDEKTLEVPTAAGGRWRSVRAYDKAAAVIKRGEEGLKPSLRTERSLLAMQIDPKAATLFSPRGPLTRDELEVTDVLGNSLLLDRLLPEKPVPIGYSWKPPEKVIAVLLGLDAVSQCDVQSTLKEATDTVARFELAGRVEGTILDAPTQVEIKGKYRVDRRLMRIDWLGLLLKKQKGIGEVEVGLNIAARVQVTITPKDACPALSAAALKGLVLEPAADLLRLTCGPARGGWELAHDRRWHQREELSDMIVLKLLDQDDFVAQCNIAPLPQRPPDKPVSLQEFQEDTRRALGKSFREFLAAKESTDEANRKVYRLVIRGEEKEVPIQWNYYLVADKQGRQAVFAFTMQEKLADRLNKADEQLVHAIRFVEPKTAAKSKK